MLAAKVSIFRFTSEEFSEEFRFSSGEQIIATFFRFAKATLLLRVETLEPMNNRV
jgi:hypothetical protein